MTVVGVLLQILGTFLVAREVWTSISSEQALGGLGRVETLLHLYAREDYRGFWIVSQLDQGVGIEKARAMADGLGDEAIRTAIESQFPIVTAIHSIRRADELTKPAVIRRRRGLLVAGAFSLMVGAALPTIGLWLGL